MRWQISRLVPRSALAVLVVLLVAAMAGFAAVSHLVTRFNLNQQARARKLFAQGLADQSAGNLNAAVDDFRAALTGDPSNSQYQLALGRALRDTGDPRQLEEAKSYLQDLWQRAPKMGLSIWPWPAWRHGAVPSKMHSATITTRCTEYGTPIPMPTGANRGWN